MAAKKFALSVPEEVMDQVDQAAAERGMTRSGYLVELLRKIARARNDAEVTRRLDDIFADPELRKSQAATARALTQRMPKEGTQW